MMKWSGTFDIGRGSHDPDACVGLRPFVDPGVSYLVSASRARWVRCNGGGT